MSRHHFLPFMVGLGLALAACGGGEEEAGSPQEDAARRAGLALPGSLDVGEAPPPVTAPLPQGVEVPESAGSDPRTQVGRSIQEGRTTALVQAAGRVAPAVVSVNVLRRQRVRPRSLWEEMFLPPGATRQSTSYGSGIIFRPDGYVLTNDHVVRGAQEIRVTLPDGRDFAAELVGTDGVTDVAVLRISGTDLPVAPLGSSRGLLIGEWSVAIGNPFAYLLSNSEPTVTAGVISAAGRHIIPSDEDQGFYLGMIQTDASINPGNSGGPLVNALGEVIGVNTSIFSRSGGSEGLGFAIPVDRALRVAEDLMAFGEVRRAWTGLDVEAVDADAWGRTRGVQVSSVAPGSPADDAGLSAGDRLLRANGQPLGTPLDFEAVLLDLRAGEAVEVETEGAGRPYRIVTETLPTARAQRVEVLEDLEVITVTPEVRLERNLGSEGGALITGISPELSRSLGLREGDVLLGINRQTIRTAEDAAEAIQDLQPGSRVRIYFERNGQVSWRDFYIRR
jgi:serine protease Do